MALEILVHQVLEVLQQFGLYREVFFLHFDLVVDPLCLGRPSPTIPPVSPRKSSAASAGRVSMDPLEWARPAASAEASQRTNAAPSAQLPALIPLAQASAPAGARGGHRCSERHYLPSRRIGWKNLRCVWIKDDL